MSKETKRKVTFEITNCLDCPHHSREADPDPHDSWNRDDEKVVCKKAKRNVTVADRPYQVRKNCEIPEWCPLLNALQRLAEET